MNENGEEKFITEDHEDTQTTAKPGLTLSMIIIGFLVELKGNYSL